MKDKKFRILVWLVVAWAGMFLLTMKVKSPRLEQVDLLILFVCLGWFAYWTISTINQLKEEGHAFTDTDTMILKKQPSTEVTPTKEPHAKTKKTQ